MRRINEQLHFLFSLTLLTLKEEKSYKEIIDSKLQRVKKRVNLRHFGFDLTPGTPAASNLNNFLSPLYLYSVQIVARIKIFICVKNASNILKL